MAKIPKISLYSLVGLEALSFVLHLGSAIFLFVESSRTTVKPMLNMRYQSYTEENGFKNETLEVGRFNILLALAFMELITAISNLASIVSIRVWFQYARQGLNLIWLEYCITSSIMTTVLAVILGYDDVFVVVIFGLQLFVTNIVGLGIELREYYSRHDFTAKMAGSSVWLPFFYSSVTTVLPWAAFFGSFIASTARASTPGWVQGAFFSQFFCYCLFAIVFAAQRIWNPPIFVKYGIYRMMYDMLSVTAKMFLVWFLAAGVIFRD